MAVNYSRNVQELPEFQDYVTNMRGDVTGIAIVGLLKDAANADGSFMHSPNILLMLGARSSKLRKPWSNFYKVAKWRTRFTWVLDQIKRDA